MKVGLALWSRQLVPDAEQVALLWMAFLAALRTRPAGWPVGYVLGVEHCRDAYRR